MRAKSAAPRSRAVLLAGLSVLVFSAAPSTAFAKRRRRPAADSDTPATEVGQAASTTAGSAPPSASDESKSASSSPADAKGDPKADVKSGSGSKTTTTSDHKEETPPPALGVVIEHAAPAPQATELVEPAAAVATASARPASSRERPGDRVLGHVGVASPLVTLRASRNAGKFTSVNDDFTLVAPIGLGIKIGQAWKFDLEFQISTGVRPEGLTTAIVDPGFLYCWRRVAAGMRVAWQLNVNQNVGLIPVVDIGLVQTATTTWFVEVALPSFVQNKQLTSSGFLQTGVGF